MNLFKLKYTGKSDEELMTLIQVKKEHALEELYKRYSLKMSLYFCRMFYGDYEKGKDFTQDLFLKVIEKASYFNTGMKFSTWLYTLASNMCKNEFKKERIRNDTSFPLKSSNFHEDYERQIDLQSFNEELYIALKEIDYEHKTAFLLRYGSELSIKEIAYILDCPEGTVKSRLYYTIKYLSKKLTIYKQS